MTSNILECKSPEEIPGLWYVQKNEVGYFFFFAAFFLEDFFAAFLAVFFLAGFDFFLEGIQCDFGVNKFMRI